MREIGGPGHSQECLLELSETPEEEKCFRRTKCFNNDLETVPIPRSGKALSPEADVSLPLDVVMAHMPSPIQKDPCHLGTRAQVIVTVLVSGPRAILELFWSLKNIVKRPFLKLKGLGCRTCLAGLREFSILGLRGEGNSFWGELTKNGGGSSSLSLLSF